MPPVKFRVSSGLKSILGRDLITDDFIAVFELVKNSFDAHATRVTISFEDLDTEEARIVIRDNGKGMSIADLKNKWLFVAYSAKKDGTEDYRQRIRSPRRYAGAKGIGRFSCDKLGRRLELVTRAKGSVSSYVLRVDWDKFEEDAKKEFARIPVDLRKRTGDQQKISKGTVLKVTGLRESWNRAKLLKLKQSLQKLINPNQGNDSRSFSVVLHAKSELEADAHQAKSKPWNKVNGPIANFLFEELKIKSTFVHVRIPSDGESIVTRLEDRGRFIYETVEKNDTGLHGIDLHLFALNQVAKAAFTKRMGVPAVQFGSVFLFKNGFRIYPFGEVGEDSWGIDRRKQQGTARFLGTRDLIGRVEISGDNPNFQEATSRDGGLIQNEQVDSLQKMFFEYGLKRLERFAVEIIKYGNQDTLPGEFHAKCLELILQLTKSKALLHVDYDPHLLDIVNEASEKSLNSLISQFGILAETIDNPHLAADIRKAQRRIRELEKAKEEAEAESAKAAEDRQKAERQAEEDRSRAEKSEKTARAATKKSARYESQNLFLQSLVSADVTNLVGLHHHIGIAAHTIQNYVQSMTKRIRLGKPTSTEMFIEALEKISLQASQIGSTVRFATKANFNLDAAVIKKDIVEFVREYLLNVCRGLVVTDSQREMEFKWQSEGDATSVRNFRPLEVVVLLDNLLSNARKAGATCVSCIARADNDNTVTITFHDNGRGVSDSARDRAFEMGFTTTNGAGFGLYHALGIAKGLGGDLRLNSQNKRGAEFIWEIPK